MDFSISWMLVFLWIFSHFMHLCLCRISKGFKNHGIQGQRIAVVHCTKTVLFIYFALFTSASSQAKDVLFSDVETIAPSKLEYCRMLICCMAAGMCYRLHYIPNGSLIVSVRQILAFAAIASSMSFQTRRKEQTIPETIEMFRFGLSIAITESADIFGSLVVIYRTLFNKVPKYLTIAALISVPLTRALGLFWAMVSTSAMQLIDDNDDSNNGVISTTTTKVSLYVICFVLWSLYMEESRWFFWLLRGRKWTSLIPQDEHHVVVCSNATTNSSSNSNDTTTSSSSGSNREEMKQAAGNKSKSETEVEQAPKQPEQQQHQSDAGVFECNKSATPKTASTPVSDKESESSAEFSLSSKSNNNDNVDSLRKRLPSIIHTTWQGTRQIDLAILSNTLIEKFKSSNTSLSVVFRLWDQNGDGHLNVDDFQKGVESLGMFLTIMDVQAIFRHVLADKQKMSFHSFQELITATKEKSIITVPGEGEELENVTDALRDISVKTKQAKEWLLMWGAHVAPTATTTAASILSSSSITTTTSIVSSSSTTTSTTTSPALLQSQLGTEDTPPYEQQQPPSSSLPSSSMLYPSIWIPIAKVSRIKRNRFLFCISHNASTSRQPTQQKHRPVTLKEAKVLQLKDQSIVRIRKSKELDPNQINILLPQPEAFQLVFAILDARHPLYIWRIVPPSSDFVALSMVATLNSSPPSRDVIRCVPSMWLRGSQIRPLLVWKGEVVTSQGTTDVGYIWSCSSMGLLHATFGDQSPSATFEFHREDFKIGDEPLSSIALPVYNNNNNNNNNHQHYMEMPFHHHRSSLPDIRSTPLPATASNSNATPQTDNTAANATPRRSFDSARNSSNGLSPTSTTGVCQPLELFSTKDDNNKLESSAATTSPPPQETYTTTDPPRKSQEIQEGQRKTEWEAAAVKWSPTPANVFKIRGPTYPDDGIKITASHTVFELMHVHLFSSVGNGRVDMCSLKQDSFLTRRRLMDDDRFYMCIVFQSPPHHLALYYAASPQSAEFKSGPFASVWRQFLERDDEFRNSRWKVIPWVCEGPWIVKRSVGYKPALLGTKLTQTYTIQPNLLHIDCDVNSSRMAAWLVGLLGEYASAVALDLGFVIQGECEDELPEYLLGTVKLDRLSVSNARATTWRQ